MRFDPQEAAESADLSSYLSTFIFVFVFEFAFVFELVCEPSLYLSTASGFGLPLLLGPRRQSSRCAEQSLAQGGRRMKC